MTSSEFGKDIRLPWHVRLCEWWRARYERRKCDWCSGRFWRGKIWACSGDVWLCESCFREYTSTPYELVTSPPIPDEEEKVR